MGDGFDEVSHCCGQRKMETALVMETSSLFCPFLSSTMMQYRGHVDEVDAIVVLVVDSTMMQYGGRINEVDVIVVHVVANKKHLHFLLLM